ncbi:MAG: hypothetical protein GY849_25200, partial [Deltaproteobacteria bacterium]|nr:hypothetical protein [Deltaproteobacteria bacterium]
ILVMVCFFLPGSASALMPPDDMAKRNLEAKLILIGEVKGTGKVLLPEKGGRGKKGVFVLEVLHVIKGYGKVKPGDEVHILFRLPPRPKKGLKAHRAGSLQVKVEEGNLVVVYINPYTFPPFHRPVAEGASVAVIAPFKAKQARGDKKTGK